jgi:hypothetical protein
MNKTRRTLVTTLPLLPLVGLPGCGGGGDDHATDAGGQGEQAAAVGTAGGYGLKVASTRVYNGYLSWTTYTPDTIWTDYTDLVYITPASSMPNDPVALCNGCVTVATNNQGAVTDKVLYFMMTEEIRGQRRAVVLKFRPDRSVALQGQSFDLSKLPAGDASVVVNDATGGHYEYALNTGKVKIQTWDDNAATATLLFTSVVGWPLPTATVPGNRAGAPLSLSGTLFSRFRTEKAGWMMA